MLLDRFKGSIIGAAAGDALGAPTEYISREALDRFYNGKVTKFEDPCPESPCKHLKAGQWTDDTQQMILLAESLIVSKGLDINDLGKRMGEWGYKCQNIPGYNRFAGGTSMRAALALYNGEDPRKTGVSRATCGSAMRIAPVGLFYHNATGKNLFAATYWASAVTHTHPAAIDSAQLISHLVASLTKGKTPFEATEKAQESMRYDPQFQKRIQYVINNRKQSPNEVAKVVGKSESSYETIPMALHCFLHSPNDFEKTIVYAANLVSGDTDSIACIAGAMSGAYNGLSEIPRKFTETLEEFEYLENLATRLKCQSI